MTDRLVTFKGKRRIVRERLPEDGPTPEAMRAAKQLTLPQFLFGAKKRGWLTEGEALAYSEAGILPLTLQQVQSALTGEALFLSRLQTSSRQFVSRTSGLVAALAAIKNITPEDLDAFFDEFAKLENIEDIENIET